MRQAEGAFNEPASRRVIPNICSPSSFSLSLRPSSFIRYYHHLLGPHELQQNKSTLALFLSLVNL